MANELIPREILFGLPEITLPQISPDGKKIALLRRVNNVLNIWLKEGEEEKQITFEKERSIIRYIWAPDSRHILYMKDSDGDENWHIYSVSLENGEIKDITPFPGVQARILRMHPSHPDEIIIDMNKRDPAVYDVYRLHLKTSKLELEAKNPGNLMTGFGEDWHGWVVDKDLKVLGGHFVCEDGGVELRIIEDGAWKSVLKWPVEESLFSTCLSVSDEGFYIYDARETPTYSLSLLNIKTGERKVLASHPHYDVLPKLLKHPVTEKILGVCVYKERGEWIPLDDEVREDFEFLSTKLDGDYWITSQSFDNNLWIVDFVRDDLPDEFYLYIRKEKKLEFLFSTRALLKEYSLSKKETVFIKSRDGYRLLCYLTFPQQGKKNLPMVVLAHGGPWSRDVWDFEPFSQWLANRGYLCLQVNFRGSMGFGKEFLNAGDREWGGKMHTDIVDAVEWCIKEGYADKERIGIMGGSYGGYAALAGATFTPDLFKCAISICGPSNLITLLKAIPPYWRTYWEILRRRVGDPDKDEEFLKARSPYFNADKIKIPLLIAQGANDPRVKKEESEQIVRALRERGKEVEYILFENEGHGLLRHENRLKFYQIAEKFLAKHLGGKYLE